MAQMAGWYKSRYAHTALHALCIIRSIGELLQRREGHAAIAEWRDACSMCASIPRLLQVFTSLLLLVAHLNLNSATLSNFISCPFLHPKSTLHLPLHHGSPLSCSLFSVLGAALPTFTLLIQFLQSCAMNRALIRSQLLAYFHTEVTNDASCSLDCAPPSRKMFGLSLQGIQLARKNFSQSMRMGIHDCAGEHREFDRTMPTYWDEPTNTRRCTHTTCRRRTLW
ncbi:hypothetical protein GOP47_0013995 [Adiantum capillus-veneris]|uniref:Uncharacterized protein n=1 Tax=Adiantum capillus-veneris TaxID=13818 RepID=A0A9D4UQ31_ADICA|nr:hypothetical protein GOP47_0013995 [Adiantum capillus-veneris]